MSHKEEVPFPGTRISRYTTGPPWLDEVFVEDPTSVHIERMDENDVWMNISTKGGHSITIHFSALNKKTVDYTVETDQ